MSLFRLSIVVGILIAAVGLALSNPTMDDYIRFVEQELSNAMDRMDPATSTREQQFIRQVFRSQSKKLLESFVRPNTARRNWGILSYFETHVADTTVVVLGLGGDSFPFRALKKRR